MLSAIRPLLLVLAVTLFTTTVFAEPDGRATPERYAVGLDLVSTTAFHGVGLEAGLRSEHWRGRIAYAHQRIPAMFVEMDSRDKGWSVTTDLGAAAVDYWLATTRDGVYFTVEAAVNRIQLRSPSGGTATPYEPALAPGAGYHWSPFGNAFYVEPRLFFIINGPVIAGSETQAARPIIIPP